MAKIKVLIVDDSSVVRLTLSKALGKFSDIDVIGTAFDPFIARDKILKLNPDVVTLDIEMPKMDGLTFLRKLMKHYPIPVVMVSALTQKGCETTLNCLEAGAIDFVTKTATLDVETNRSMIGELVDKIRIASKAKVSNNKKRNAPETVNRPVLNKAMVKTSNKVIAIGASTGGTEALKDVLSRVPADSPGILVVQHMPEKFTTTFAERLDSLCKISVREAKDNDTLIPGLALIAPGRYHMELKRDGARYFVKVKDGELVNRHRPSVDVLFNSVAKYAGSNAVGVILTGMGADGASGMLKMKKNGAKTIAQDEKSCVVFGMPKEAIKLGGVDKIVALNKVSETIMHSLTG